MKRLAIIGSSDLAQLIAYHAVADKQYEVVGFYDDFKNHGDNIEGVVVLGKINNIENDYKAGKFDLLMSGIGYKYMDLRKSSFEKLCKTIPFAKLIHSSCNVDGSATISSGCFLLPGCTLDRNVKLGENVLLNTGCVIAHDSTVDTHSFLSPAVAIAGFSSVGKCCNIGINTTIIDNIKVGDHVQTGGGAVVIESINEPGLYIGVPAKKIVDK